MSLTLLSAARLLARRWKNSNDFFYVLSSAVRGASAFASPAADVSKMAADGTLYHLVPAADWAAARASGQPYKPRTYEQDGFTHLTLDADALMAVANHFYKDVPGDFLLLSCDPQKLSAQVKMEPAAPVGETPAHESSALFPHLYGPINLDAVVEETSVDRTPSGKFLGILWGISVIHTRADWLKLGV